ncbi:MAG: hypothetical protein QM723_14265 [Myxococcaceae bacterium]
MPDFPDVLDHLGKTPREFGSVQVHLEPLIVDDGWGWTAVWFQAAYAPADSASFEVVNAADPSAVLVAAQQVPELSDGRVWRGYLRFKVPDEVTQIALRVKSALLPRAERCRQAWKLFDTLEIPKESDLRGASGGPSINIGTTVAASLLAAPLGFAVISFNTGGGDSGPSLAQQTRVSVHKARELPDFVLSDVVRDRPAPPPGQGFTVYWRPGEPMPEPLPMVLPPRPAAAPAATKPKTGRRECGKCGFSGKREDFGSDKYCPDCGHEWD